jgi:alanyl-tRNA synthetase
MTERLYYLDSYHCQFEAKIVEVAKSDHGAVITLDRTGFYPESGGQPCDQGTIGSCRVLEVLEGENGEILHRVEGLLEPGQQAVGQVDWKRRLDHMQQHTGQHILSQAFLRETGMHTVGFHMGADYATIDLEGGDLTKEKRSIVEDMANRVVQENRMVSVRIVPPEQVQNLGLRRESKREGNLRVIEIENFDLSACGGTHVHRTGEIGAILIKGFERVNRQLRVEFRCGLRAIRSHRDIVSILDQASRKFSVGWWELPDRIERQFEEIRSRRKAFQEKNELVAQMQMKELFNGTPVQTNGVRIIRQIVEGEDAEFLKRMAQTALQLGPCLVILGNRSSQAHVLLAQSAELTFDLKTWIVEACQWLEGRGGGNPSLVQGGGKKMEKLEPALDWIEHQAQSTVATSSSRLE